VNFCRQADAGSAAVRMRDNADPAVFLRDSIP